MGLALFCVAVFVAGWVTGRWDIIAERTDRVGAWLRGPRLLVLCGCLVFAGALYVQNTPSTLRLLGPSLLEQH